MSAVRNPRLAVVAPDEEVEAPFVAPPLRLAPVAGRRRRPKIAYAAVVVVGVFAIVAGQLLLSIALSDGAYQISSLQSQKKELDRTAQALGEQVATKSSPQSLASSAETLGMVSNTSPVYLRLSDGAVLGDPAPATKDAGGVIGGASLLANAALTGTSPQIPQIPQIPQTPAAPAAQAGPPTVAWQGQLPAPTTR